MEPPRIRLEPEGLIRLLFPRFMFACEIVCHIFVWSLSLNQNAIVHYGILVSDRLSKYLLAL